MRCPVLEVSYGFLRISSICVSWSRALNLRLQYCDRNGSRAKREDVSSAGCECRSNEAQSNGAFTIVGVVCAGLCRAVVLVPAGHSGMLQTVEATGGPIVCGPIWSAVALYSVAVARPPTLAIICSEESHDFDLC